MTDSLITNGQPVCRVCFEHGAEPLYSPCKCDGSAKYIHERCMLTWFHKTRRKSCEICLSKINIKSTGCKPLVKVCFHRNLIESLDGRESRNCVNMCENMQPDPLSACIELTIDIFFPRIEIIIKKLKALCSSFSFKPLSGVSENK